MGVRSVVALCLAAACGSSPQRPPADAGDAADVDPPVEAEAAADVVEEPTPLARLTALTTGCANVLGGTYQAKSDPAVSVCGLNGAVYWNAGMNIDCDGITTSTCNSSTDPDYQAQTSALDSMGNYLDATVVPYVVIPLPSSRWDSTMAGIQLGSVVLVLYQGQVQYGIFGDEGPPSLIGEASVAMANLFGIDSDPATGGADTGVTYVVFTGPSGVVTKNEDHAEAVTIGQARLTQLLQDN